MDLAQSVSISSAAPTVPVDHRRTVRVMDSMLSGYPAMGIEPGPDDVFAVSLILKSQPTTWSPLVRQFLSKKSSIAINLGDFRQSLIYRHDGSVRIRDGGAFHKEMSWKSAISIFYGHALGKGAAAKRDCAFWGYRLFGDVFLSSGSLRFSLFLKLCANLKSMVVFVEQFGAFHGSMALDDQFVTEIFAAIDALKEREDALFREFIIVDPLDAIYQFVDQHRSSFEEEGWILGSKMYKNPAVTDGHSRPSLWIHKMVNEKQRQSC